MADFILSLQDAGGAIKDSPDSSVCNEDSNMEYALLGLAAAYAYSHDSRYLTGFENGIVWLADRQDMTSSPFRGSWFYTYDCAPPYDHVPTSPGSGVIDVRGVDTTSAYFAYLLYVHGQITHNDSLVTRYSTNARAALDFVIRKNLDPQGISWSSYQLRNGTWELWRYQYTADNADVYLGFMGGAALYDDKTSRTYGLIAENLKHKILDLFYDGDAHRYAEGIDYGKRTWSDGFDSVFPQGYTVWALGPSAASNNAYKWLLDKVTPDGSVVAYPGDPGYALSAANLIMAANTLSVSVPTSTLDWLLTVPYQPTTGGVSNTARESIQYANVAAFCIVALLAQPPSF